MKVYVLMLLECTMMSEQLLYVFRQLELYSSWMTYLEKKKPNKQTNKNPIGEFVIFKFNSTEYNSILPNIFLSFSVCGVGI